MVFFFLIGSPNWARTSDIMINSHALYRLSYRGMSVMGKCPLKTEQRIETKLKEMCELVSAEIVYTRQQFKPSVY